ncbi:efflux RND transporter periplasmic adaptor subunit [Nocardioides aromaticivorans]|nr:biotin/lipoyl-binding protein [Nocardioides aromaticivorans]
MRKLLHRVRPPWRRPRRLVLVLSALVVVAGLAGAWLLLRGDEPAAASTTTATVSTQTLKQTVTASGTVAAATTADLSFDVSGTVTRVLVEPGDTVKKGQRLARVDDDVLQAELEAAQSSLDAAESARSEHVSDGASDVQLAADEAAVLAAESSLAEAQDAVDDAVLRSTIAGTVTDVGIEVGDSAGSSGSGQPSTGTTSTSTGSDTSSGTITVVSTGHFVVDATVSSSDVEKVEKGMQAEVTVSGIDETVYGTVAEVGLVAETDSSGAAAFPVTIEVTGERDDLYAGTSADVAVVVSQRADVLTVDSRALRTDGDTTYVEKVTDSTTGATERVTVETGETSGLVTEVTSGLAEGDVVQVPGFAGPGGSGGDEQMQEFQRQMQERMQDGGGFPGGGQGGFPGAPQ